MFYIYEIEIKPGAEIVNTKTGKIEIQDKPYRVWSVKDENSGCMLWYEQTGTRWYVMERSSYRLVNCEAA